VQPYARESIYVLILKIRGLAESLLCIFVGPLACSTFSGKQARFLFLCLSLVLLVVAASSALLIARSCCDAPARLNFIPVLFLVLLVVAASSALLIARSCSAAPAGR
jgi:hypothetical protein